MENIKTTTRTAYNPDTGEKYQIDFPALEEIRKALVELTFPTNGMTIVYATEKLTTHFSLDEEQRNAKMKRKNSDNYIDLFYGMVARAFQDLFEKKKLKQPGGERTPYFLAEKEEQGRDENQVVDHEGDNEKDQQDEKSINESIEDIYQRIREKLAEELLDNIKNNSPTFFEELVIDLLVAMGYGGSRADAEAVGRSHDGGIDGIIKEDPFGLDVIYVRGVHKY